MITVSPRMYAELRRQAEASALSYNPESPLGPPRIDTWQGVRLQSSSVFPYHQKCSWCGGTGSGGEESTYCPSCVGRGGIMIEGAIRDQRGTSLIESPLPRLFEPSFPSDVPVPLREISR